MGYRLSIPAVRQAVDLHVCRPSGEEAACTRCMQCTCMHLMLAAVKLCSDPAAARVLGCILALMCHHRAAMR